MKNSLVRSVSRSAEELFEMGLEGQLKVVSELRALADGNAITLKAFKKLTAEERAGYLSAALQDYDKATAHTVHGIAAPVRTADDACNQEAWSTFALRVQDAVTDLARDDCKQISTQYLEGGVLVMGYRPPPEQLDPFVSAPRRVIATPMRYNPIGGTGEVGELITSLVSELGLLSVRGHGCDTKEVEEAIERSFKGRPVHFLDDAIARIEGVVSRMEKDVEVPKAVLGNMLPFLRKIVVLLRNHASLQLC